MSVHVSEQSIAELKQKILEARWPEKETVNDWDQGVPLAYLKDLCEDWQNHDWREAENLVNALGSDYATIQDLKLHYLHISSGKQNATPLLLIHGWPGSVMEFFDSIPFLTNPQSGDLAFDLVIPSLPGFGFSEKPEVTGYGIEKIASMFNELMLSLGYSHYIAQGGDWGSEISVLIAENHRENCIGAHINMVTALPPAEVLESPTPGELQALQQYQLVQAKHQSYLQQQATMPQTLSYSLTDSPVGQAAWIVEKFYFWTDNTGSPETAIERKKILDNISLYWFTASAGSSAKLYWESIPSFVAGEISANIACSIFPKEIVTPSRRWAESRFKSIVSWSETEKGGHFAAMEQPELFASEVISGAKALIEADNNK